MSAPVPPLVEIRLTVHLPGECTDTGVPTKYGFVRVIPTSAVRLADPDTALPAMMERAVKTLAFNLQFR